MLLSPWHGRSGSIPQRPFRIDASDRDEPGRRGKLLQPAFPDVGPETVQGQKIVLDGTVARLAEAPDTLAGSANNLFGIFQLALSFGIPAEAAVRMASETPARALGVEDEVGSIANGKRADFLVLKNDFSLSRVFIAGKELSEN